MFPPNNVPLLGQQQQQAKAGIMQAVQRLSMQIYTRVAASYIARGNNTPDFLRDLARESFTVAQCYFEGLGIAQFGNRQEKDQGNGEVQPHPYDTAKDRTPQPQASQPQGEEDNKEDGSFTHDIGFNQPQAEEDEASRKANLRDAEGQPRIFRPDDN